MVGDFPGRFSKMENKPTHIYICVLMRWLNKIIVTGRTKAPLSAHNFFRVYLSILEGVPTKLIKHRCENKIADMVA